MIWYPLGIDLILYTYNLFNALIALPLQLAFNLPAASNLSLLFATTMSGFGTYLLACYVFRIPYSVKDCQPQNAEYAIRNTQYVLRLAAFLAGLIYAFASNRATAAARSRIPGPALRWSPVQASRSRVSPHRAVARPAPTLAPPEEEPDPPASPKGGPAQTPSR